jgi:hypothetical protein
MTTRRGWMVAVALVVLGSAGHGDGPLDNLPDKVRRVPPPGVAVPMEVREKLQAGADELGREIEKLRDTLAKKPALLELLPDVQIYHNAVRYALKYDEFFKAGEFEVASKLIEQGKKRAEELAKGQPSWTKATGLVVRGYLSKIDGSVQPYGLVVPASYVAGSATKHRLDFWYHGRGETLSELNFIDGRQKSPGEFVPADAFVLHPYGRYCNANHFAGEIDSLEALEHARKHYRIDDNRVVVRGFSMGGAACWNFAVHYADRWVAAAPGAGFSETPDFLRVFQSEKLAPTPWERKLWHLYDCNDYAINLFHCPTVAYSGDKDSQKQAADIMVKACAEEGIALIHVIGPGTGHSYHPAAKVEINRRIDSIAAVGRETMPRKIRFTTWTLRYPSMHWVHIDGMEEHWERARVDADIIDDATVRVATKNVAVLTLKMAPGLCPLDMTKSPHVLIDGQDLKGAPVQSDRSWISHFKKSEGKWQPATSSDDGVLRKRPGLQGPIDDAFMDRFVMVRPTGEPINEKVGKWVAGEMQHAVDHWRRQFRGEITPKDDSKITDADIASCNLILWGDPRSNAVLAKIADKLPIVWKGDSVIVGKQTYPAATHMPALIFPNPLNPKKYVVLNSGFTFREYDYLNNARQIPKLPDWAVFDVARPTTSRHAAGIAAAGFFSERWEAKGE